MMTVESMLLKRPVLRIAVILSYFRLILAVFRDIKLLTSIFVHHSEQTCQYFHRCRRRQMACNLA